MDRTQKQQNIEDLNQIFSGNTGVFLFGFSGIDVPDITQLRHEIYKGGSRYQVVKNRLAKRAAEDTAVAQLSEYFSGPTAIAYTSENVVGLAKAVKKFAEDHSGFEFKAGVLNETALSADEVKQLADMPSREELLSKVVFLMQAPLRQFAAALQSPLRNLASGLKQIAEQKEE
ncbi:MAG TPA: 50S ribosomal protein L10 [Acidobacteriota bacterium]|nr:50S ribosomal protein L10 [Acidobacteriota bacterium]